MATISTFSADRRVDMSSAALVECESTPGADETSFGYRTGPTDADLVYFNGTGLTYAGSGDAVELTGGNIHAFRIDIAYDSFVGATDMFITDLTGVVASAIDKDDANSIWREVLNGKDTFDLTGLDEDEVGLGSNVIFGDDREHRGVLDDDDKGAKDRFVVGDNDFKIYGDVFSVYGHAGADVRYVGAADRIASGGGPSGGTDRSIRVAGDAGNVLTGAYVRGGDDRITFADFAGTALVAGDVDVLYGDSGVFGGADVILLDCAPGAHSISVGGDVAFMSSGSTLRGGDDFIRVGGARAGAVGVGGDVYSMNPDAQGQVNGGDDTVIGSQADDRLAGEVLTYAFTTAVVVNGGNDLIDGGEGDDQVYGETGFDHTLNSGGDDTLRGGRANDEVYGQSGDDHLFGDDGKDTLYGGVGADALDGGEGGDLLDGGEGVDTLAGGAGRDLITGGAGADRLAGGDDGDIFSYLAQTDSAPASSDQIAGFVHLLDDIDVSAIDAIAGGTDDSFKFIGDHAFKKAGQIRAVQDGADTLVEFNTTGGGGAEMAIVLTGFTASTLTALDFVL
jgi:Ca2+-binding RTX toxin-like protein